MKASYILIALGLVSPLIVGVLTELIIHGYGHLLAEGLAVAEIGTMVLVSVVYIWQSREPRS